MPHSPFRLLRTTVMGATVMTLAAGAHLLAGGTLPVAPIMAALLALHILCSTIATKFRLSLPVMVAMLASSQLVLHQGFDALSHGAQLTGTSLTNAQGNELVAHHSMSPEAHASAMLAQATTAMAGTAMGPGVEAMAHANHLSGWMLAAHVASTLAAAALLASGENALWSLANWLRPLYRLAAVVRVLPAQKPGTLIIVRPLPQLPWRNIRPNTRRGPPLRVAFFA